jgi:hypothetical protein
MRLGLLLSLVDAHFHGDDSQFQFLQALKSVEEYYRKKGKRYTADCLKSRIDNVVAIWDGKKMIIILNWQKSEY